jgi:hypothetical protein
MRDTAQGGVDKDAVLAVGLREAQFAGLRMDRFFGGKSF